MEVRVLFWAPKLQKVQTGDFDSPFCFPSGTNARMPDLPAGMAESVDALDSKSSALKSVRVRVPLPAPEARFRRFRNVSAKAKTAYKIINLQRKHVA
ncbi:hypothetical protein THICB2_630009 [Thiomonas sp. CB2]|nr:hypothetical protein THICB2_630009 [Thiomonas sp. CB2]VDY03873.1 conserved protein of unknown function [Thiomonas sp. Bio17B3]VDY08950.1 conserved protein of unknown function [Thiomonas sp. Sup16B3]VDY12122.1 conserved protein of unknown function [Thiomonas sp. OC7]VDY18661.1 conserved protein of unknown function [Thiomonas sp. CB2]